MEKLKGVTHDLLRAFTLCTIGAAVIFLLMFIGTWLLKGMNSQLIMENTRNALFIPGSLGLFLSVLFIIQRKSSMNLKFEHQWKAKFYALGPASLLLLISFGLLFYGILWDWALFYS